ncbi:MAG: integrase [Chloroflexi bacterium]|nr:integrase [Chloroflexota bacterium]
MAKHLAKHGEMEISDELLEKLGCISVSTTGRILRRIRQDQPQLRRKRPKRSTRIQRNIPAGRIAWDEQEPGHFEVDTVYHCGPDASGHYVHSLQMVDVTTLLSERVAVLGRSHLVMKDGFSRIAARLPIPVKELHPDNGSEFLNNLVLDFWEATFEGVKLSRSHPYKKNDNRFVEQRNLTLVRNYLGYKRFDTVAHTRTLNQLYDKLWLYDNFFQPVMHLIEKKVVPSSDGSTSPIKRRYDLAKTPFDRLCATGILSQEQQEYLDALRERTNPRQLRKDIYALIDHISSLPNAIPGKTEDVYQTLLTPIDESSKRKTPE